MESLSIKLGFAVVWIVISAFTYGFHISALNSAQDAITCRGAGQSDARRYLGPCIPMSENRFGLLTSVYTLSGLAGSLYAARLANVYGRRRAVVLASSLAAIGSVIMALSRFFFLILLGRFIVGIGCGLATVLVPTFLSEIAPPHIRGSVGVMNQLGIVLGILAGQLVSLPLSKPYLWRGIFITSALVNLFQLCLTPLMIESPKWVIEQQAQRLSSTLPPEQAPEESAASLDTPDLSLSIDDDRERQRLLTSTATRVTNQVHARATPFKEELTISRLFREWNHNPALASGLKIVLIAHLAQQLSGINAVLYYSTSIMKSVLPTQAAYISLFITFINVIMTFPPLFLVERLGRKSLLLISSSMMALMSLLLALSINMGLAQVSSLAIVFFTASFSVGLGPIPFVILSEVVPAYAVSATSSLGLGVNWASNFLVGLFFLPLRNAMASPDGNGDGNVFFVFTAISTIATLLILRVYQQ